MKLIVSLLVLAATNLHAESLKNLDAENCQVTDRDSRIRIITELVQGYQKDALQRNGKPITLRFPESQYCYITAQGRINSQGEGELSMHNGVLALPIDSMVMVACHELGHILGKITMSSTGIEKPSNPTIGVEGEADYFAGSCTRKALCPPDEDLCEAAIDAGRYTFEQMYGPKIIIDPDKAQHVQYNKFNGVNPSYPDPSCRMLSFIYGVMGTERPRCWYNPR